MALHQRRAALTSETSLMVALKPQKAYFSSASAVICSLLMKSLDEHRARVKQIADLAFSYGADDLIANSGSLAVLAWSAEELARFYVKCHDGFKLAQKELIMEVLYYQQLLRTTWADIKYYRGLRLKADIQRALHQQQVIEQRLHTLAHIANGIAWQILGGKIHVARRLSMRENTAKFLDSSNLDHAIRVADEINQVPENFALISDLTGFIEIGDLLIRQDGKTGIMELKEGVVNDTLTKLFDQIEREGKTVEGEDLNQHFDKKTVEQAQRMHRQKVKMARATEIINTDRGTDPVTGKPTFVSTPTSETQYYSQELATLAVTLKSQIWAYTLVENCVHIGMYRDEGLKMASSAIPALLAEKPHMLVDWLSITNNLSEPIFAKPFERNLIIDILTGRVKVIIGLDLDNLIEVFNLFGPVTRWMTRKETAKRREITGPKLMLEHDNRGIICTLASGEEIILGMGVVSKILYDNIRPTSMADSFLNSARPLLSGEAADVK